MIFCAWPSRFSSFMVEQLQALHIAVGCFEVIQPLLLEKCGSIRQEVIQAITLELHHVSSHAGILINVLMYWLYWCVVIVFGIYYHWSRKTCWPCEIDWSTSSPACTNASYLQNTMWACALTGRPARNTVPASDALHLTAPGCNRDRLLQGEPTPPVKAALMKGRH